MHFRSWMMGAALILAGCVTPVAAEPNAKFLTEAIQINLAEISVGQLAQEKGGSDEAKSFGKMLVDDHTASNSKATALASSKGVTPPTEPTPDDKNKHDELAKLSGGQFDREFAKAMTEGHEEAISKFEAASKGDDDIAKFAQETLPTLRKHLKTAQSLGSNKSAQAESPMAPEAAKPESQMAPSGAAKTEVAPETRR